MIVVSWKVTIQRRGLKKGHTLAYWFEQMMELGDASDEEAPAPCPRKRDMSKYLQLQMISILQGMQDDNGLWRGLITIIAKRFDMACSTVYQLGEWVACKHAMGDIISPKINSQKKIQEATYLSERVHSGGCQECSTAEEAYLKKTCIINGSVKDNCTSFDCCFDHSCSL